MVTPISLDERGNLVLPSGKLLIPDSAVPTYPVYHVDCGGVAFYTTRMVGMDEPLKSELVRLRSGLSPLPGDFIACGSCGENPSPGALTYERIPIPITTPLVSSTTSASWRRRAALCAHAASVERARSAASVARNEAGVNDA